MNIVILSRGPENHSTSSLVEAAENAGHTAQVRDPFGFYLQIGGTGNRITYDGVPAEDFDVVIPRLSGATARYGGEVLSHFEWLGISVVNSAHAIADARHKFRSLRILAQHGLPVPPSLTVGSATFLEDATPEIGDYPFIIKPFYGTHGIGVMLLDTPTSLNSAVETMCDLHRDYVIQSFIAEAAGVDIRVLVVGGKVIAAMKRCAVPGEFRANIHQGANGEAITLTNEYSRIATDAAAALKLGIAGVDILETKNGPVTLEVNPSPGFEELESVTKIDIAKTMIEYAVQLAENHKRDTT
ncbi:RimK family alpha-L-glutamate ligase [Candidatus Poribacteria bacterium]|nr:RimK family alpha-L-glutamate ligase [Candidatus Poribacteria bacterium]